MWRVLIVEDDKKICQRLAKGLNKHAQCTMVHTGEDALESYRKAIKSKKPFEFILLDVYLGGITGFDVLKKIREEEEKKAESLPEAFIVMTTTFKDSLAQMYNMGWDDFITKPIETKKLINHLQALADNRVKNNK